MIHLFHNVFLDFDFKLNHSNKFILISPLAGEGFVTPHEGNLVWAYQSLEGLFKQVLLTEEEGRLLPDVSPEILHKCSARFWGFLRKFPKEEKLIIFAEENFLLELLCQYYRSTCSDITDDGLFDLYFLHYMKLKTVNIYAAKGYDKYRYYYKNLKVKLKDEFMTFLGEVPRVPAWSSEILEASSIELQLANYLLEEDYCFVKSFTERVQVNVLNLLRGEFVDLKENLLVSYTKLDKVFPELSGLPDWQINFNEKLIEENEIFAFLFDTDLRLASYDDEKITYIGEIYRRYKDISGEENFLIEMVFPLFKYHRLNLKMILQQDQEYKLGSLIFGRGGNFHSENALIVSHFYQNKGNENYLKQFKFNINPV